MKSFYLRFKRVWAISQDIHSLMKGPNMKGKESSARARMLRLRAMPGD